MKVLPGQETVRGEDTASFDVAPAPAETPLPYFPGYVVQRELGRSRVGAVYQAHRLGDERPAAIKVIEPRYGPTPGQAEDFLRSARFLLKLAHPHLARLIDVGALHGRFHFIAEYVAGPDAEAVLRRDGPFPVRRAVRWANQLLQALQYAHGLHFVHGDVRPGNVLVTEADGNEVLRLADFGIARLYQAAPFSGLSLSDDLATATFVPPELLLDYGNVSPAADQYAVAATLYYLLTGKHVVELPDAMHKRLSTLLRGQAVPLRERRPDVPAALAEALHKALSRTPAQRHPDIGAFRQALLRSVQA